jgi:hypothetical protein
MMVEEAEELNVMARMRARREVRNMVRVMFLGVIFSLELVLVALTGNMRE